MEQRTYLILLCACAVFLGGKAQEIAKGECKDYPVEVVQKFEAGRYVGIWYEQARYEAIFQYDMDCVTANYTARPDGQIGVLNGGKVLSSGVASTIEGFARFADPSKNEAKLIVKFPVSPEASYWVIGTDYDNYAVVWSCTDILPGIFSTNIQFLWILSRSPVLAEDKISEVEQIIAAAKLDKSKLRKTRQDVCDWSNRV